MHVKKKGKIILLVIFLAQITLIAAKADGWLEVSWQVVLIPLLPFSFLTLATFIFLMVYTYMLYKHYPHAYANKRYTLIFMVSSVLGLCTLQFVVLGWVYLSISLTVVAAIAMILTFCVATALGIYCHEIALTFCQHKEVI